MKNIKFLEVEYIESGTYVGSEEWASMRDLDKPNENYIVISEKSWEYIQEQLFRLSTLEK